jgi:hypothetical protein
MSGHVVRPTEVNANAASTDAFANAFANAVATTSRRRGEAIPATNARGVKNPRERKRVVVISFATD